MTESDDTSTTGIEGDTRPSSVAEREPALENGDRLTRSEFEARYAARPDIKKAELIEGAVRMASPVRVTQHAAPHAAVLAALSHYCAFTPSTGVAINATVRLDANNEFQPDALVWIDEEAGGRSHVSEDGYLEGAPELVVEIAASSASFDMREKLRVWRRNNVREYLVWRTERKRIDWFELADGEYLMLPRDERGVIESRVFPGLRLATKALIVGDLAALLAEVDRGVKSAEHSQFVARLATKT